jgi:hypothetical protein
MSDVWVKVPTPWAKVGLDSIIVDRRERLWIVTAVDMTSGDQDTVTARRLGSPETFEKSAPDSATVDVLRPQLEMLRDELGAR